MKWPCPPIRWRPCPAAADELALYTSLAVREDAQELFGFAHLGRTTDF